MQIRFPKISSISDISDLFTTEYFQKPLVLIIDEFDSLEEEFINSFVNIFRDIYIESLPQLKFLFIIIMRISDQFLSRLTR